MSREELREKVWADTTFVDFEHGLNAAVNKLRRALGDAAENPRYVETQPGRGYRFVGTLLQVQVAEAEPIARDSGEAVRRTEVVERRGMRWWWVALAAGCVAAGLIVAERRYAHPAAAGPWKLTRLTAEAGASNSPAMSRDGKLVAYSSDHAREGEMDLYVKQATGGQPIRITFDGAGNTSPDFSPDGGHLAFESNRDGGGIFEIATFGGEIRLLAARGKRPKYSPDGLQVAYWLGDENMASTIPGSGQVWIVSAAGGAPRRVGASFSAARYPIWSPDSKHLLMVGYTSQKLAESSALDWWLVATDRDAAVRSGIYDALTKVGMRSQDAPATPSATYPNVPAPACWIAADDQVIFSSANGDTRSLWSMGTSARTGKVSGTFQRLTAGAGNEADPSCGSANALVLTNVERKTGVWVFPFQGGGDETPAVMEPFPADPLEREPSLSGDGKLMAFSSSMAGPMNIWVRDLKTGTTSHLAGSADAQRFPAMNARGDKVAYSAFEKGGRTIYLAAGGAAPERLCEGCLRATQWSQDEKTLLTFGGTPYQVNALEIATRRQTPLVKHPSYSVLFGRLSPDERWISFTARVEPNRSVLAIAPLDGLKPVAESAWIKIAEGAAEDRMDWSKDGKTLYFSSSRDGHNCLWGQRVDADHRPSGEVFAVRHFHGSRSYEQAGWSVANGQLVIGLENGTEHIWMMTRAAAK